MYIKTRSGKRRMRHTTAGWGLLVEWKDKSMQWIPLKVSKHSNPLEMAEYAISRNVLVGIHQDKLEHIYSQRWHLPHILGLRHPKTQRCVITYLGRVILPNCVSICVSDPFHDPCLQIFPLLREIQLCVDKLSSGSWSETGLTSSTYGT